MRFDVIRSSDVAAGRTGAQAECPCTGCVFNRTENTWELEVKDLEQLMHRASLWDCAVLLLPVSLPDEIPVLQICDVDLQ